MALKTESTPLVTIDVNGAKFAEIALWLLGATETAFNVVGEVANQMDIDADDVEALASLFVRILHSEGPTSF